jgi:hypothetical protein
LKFNNNQSIRRFVNILIKKVDLSSWHVRFHQISYEDENYTLNCHSAQWNMTWFDYYYMYKIYFQNIKTCKRTFKKTDRKRNLGFAELHQKPRDCRAHKKCHLYIIVQGKEVCVYMSYYYSVVLVLGFFFFLFPCKKSALIS